LIEGFDEAGYRVNKPLRILNAGNFGVPQDRRRLFVFGARRGTELPGYPEPITTPPSELPLENSLMTCPNVRDAIADLPDAEGIRSLVDADVMEVEFKTGSRYARILRGDLTDEKDYSYPRIRDRRVLTGCRWAEHTPLSRQRFSRTPPGETEPISHFFKLSLDGVCNTLRAGTATDRGAFTAPRPIHPVFPRCITVREAARLHSYPDWFRFHRTIWHGFRQIGNSVPPLLARAVGAAIVHALGIRPAKPDRPISLGDEQLAAFTMREAATYFSVSSRTIAPRIRQASLAVR
jgi:DNA (cytosine-5)-methyltransferase 1